MAIDSREKRFSMMNIGSVGQQPGFTPNSTVDAGDKYHLLDLYFGITLDGGGVDIAIFAYHYNHHLGTMSS